MRWTHANRLSRRRPGNRKRGSGRSRTLGHTRSRRRHRFSSHRCGRRGSCRFRGRRRRSNGGHDRSSRFRRGRRHNSSGGGSRCHRSWRNRRCGLRSHGRWSWGSRGGRSSHRLRRLRRCRSFGRSFATLQGMPNFFCNLYRDRTRVRFLFGDAKTGQQVNNCLGFDL